ncbi:hypothetical protein PIB30_096561 [Stylosanthes scabra]|uniref:Uncharacterized protein n=1 Tax=Stylosanthes scabra TaxID=79078 RepID=A0ABU6QYJ0_9FABA|nr:hypothetical protein [Stylosanthes scabra]
MKLMVLLGCSKSGGAAFGIPLSVRIQDLRKWVFGRASASRNLCLNGFESAELQRIDFTYNRVDSLSHFLRKRGFREQRIDSHDLRIDSDYHRGQLIMRIDSDVLQVDYVLEMVWKRARESIQVPYPLDRRKSVTRDDITRAEVTSGGLRDDDPAYGNSGLPAAYASDPGYILDRSGWLMEPTGLQVHILEDKRSDDAFHGRRSSPLCCYES